MNNNDIPIEESIYSDCLSMRSYHICRFNELMAVSQVIAYYKELCKKYDTDKVQIEIIELTPDNRLKIN